MLVGTDSPGSKGKHRAGLGTSPKTRLSSQVRNNLLLVRLRKGLRGEVVGVDPLGEVRPWLDEVVLDLRTSPCDNPALFSFERVLCDVQGRLNEVMNVLLSVG